MNFGEKVSQLRKQNGYTQRQLADELGVSLRTITNYETGGRYPKQRDIYKKLAEVLQVDINYLLTEDESFIVYAHEQYGSKGMQQAQRLLAEVRGLFTGGELAEEDKDEMMRALQDAYWIAKENNLRRTRELEEKARREALAEVQANEEEQDNSEVDTQEVENIEVEENPEDEVQE